ncbi:MAG: purine-nucleoside phosphorylase [Bradymonadia bacterium]|jgi:purine-nucleoside phosphorylase
MTAWYDRIQEAAAAIQHHDSRVPTVAMILGSGLGSYAESLEDATLIPYGDVPHMHVSTVAGHAGQFVLGTRHGRTVIAMQGRLHAYEGHDHCDVVFPLRVMRALGAQTLIVTNAAGGIAPEHRVGDLMVITDHLNLTGRTPLLGVNDERIGPRFPDMTNAYDPELRAIALSTGVALGLTLHQGVYAGMLGPAYETPAEVRMAGLLGGHAVGMSTVPEVIAARHMSMRVLGISCITNAAAGLSDEVLDHKDVQDVAAMVRKPFMSLVDAVLGKLPEPTESARS